MPISNKQRIAMTLIVLVGLLAGAAVLWSARAGTAAPDAAPHGEGRNDSTDTHAAAADKSSKPGANETPKEPAAKTENAPRRIKLSDAQIKSAGIDILTAGPSRLQTAAEFQGEIRFNEDRTTHVVPRLAGVAEAVPATLGQRVDKGQVLAVIASTSLSDQRSELLTARKRRELAASTYEREKKLHEDRISARQDYEQAANALQEADIAVQNAVQKLAAIGAGANASSSGLNRLEIRAPLAGTIVEKHLALGEAVKEDASIFTVADLSVVWAEFAIAPKDLAAVRVGQRVVVSSSALNSKAEGTVSYVGALLGEQTRTARARVTLANPEGAWRPGLFVTVAVQAPAQEVSLAVRVEALQTIDKQPTLFVAEPGGFVARAVKVGRGDGQSVEVLDGLAPGDRYAASNSFVLKSELGKAGTEHGH